MSLNNSVLTRASRRGEFCADSAGYRKGGEYYEAVKYYGLQRSRPIFSALPGWVWDMWSGGVIRPFPEAGEGYLQLAQPDGKIKIVKPDSYLIIHMAGDRALAIVLPASQFEKEFTPIVKPK